MRGLGHAGEGLRAVIDAVVSGAGGVAAAGGAVGGVATSAVLGVLAGARVRDNPVAYWVLIAAVFLVGLLASYGGQVQGFAWLSFGGIGIIAGGLTGLRHGFAQPFSAGDPRDGAGARDHDGAGGDGTIAEQPDAPLAAEQPDAPLAAEQPDALLTAEREPR